MKVSIFNHKTAQKHCVLLNLVFFFSLTVDGLLNKRLKHKNETGQKKTEGTHK